VDAGLRLVLASFDRLIQQARTSLEEGKINIFDQYLINNFNFLGRRNSRRPLWYKLQEATYTTYKRVWKQLLCFVYRLAGQGQGPALHYSLTEAQTEALNCTIQAVAEAVQHQDPTDLLCALQLQKLDSACLQLCIALLDHALYGDIYDSILVGFLAVLGIRVSDNDNDSSNSQSRKLEEAVLYTPKLSAFIKCAQLLVLQRTVVAAEQKEVDYPATMLEVMHRRFIMNGSRSPLDWAQKLRAYSKGIQDTTTALGHIIWSDDGEELEYKGLKLSMAGLQHFLSVQEQAADRQLHELLFVAPTEQQDTVPTVDLSQLKDNPANAQPNWSFLKDPRNSSSLKGQDRWLLNRVLEQEALQKRFFSSCKDAKWRLQAARDYLAQVDAFLERLLLLIHLTGGAPARGTELLSLQAYNTQRGLRRNIFVENGLISFVTFYHKGYSITGSTKIIHRYLPKDISRMLVYYLWLIQPFCRQLCILALKEKPSPPSFLWARTKKGGAVAPWLSSRLTGVLAKEFREHLDTEAAILLWRHAAIAISRRHLRQVAKFSKDYGLETSPTWNEEQAGHLSHLASTVYARGIEEAPGHVAAARAEYRQISREWHTFLGLGGAKVTEAAEAGPPIQQPLESIPPLQQTALPQAQVAPKAVPRGPSSSLLQYMNPSQRALYMSRIKQEEVADDKPPPAPGQQLKRKALCEVPLNRVAKRQA
jgi:hypothetical protein